jgi:hypothetical protein
MTLIVIKHETQGVPRRLVIELNGKSYSELLSIGKEYNMCALSSTILRNTMRSINDSGPYPLVSYHTFDNALADNALADNATTNKFYMNENLFDYDEHTLLQLLERDKRGDLTFVEENMRVKVVNEIKRSRASSMITFVDYSVFDYGVEHTVDLRKMSLGQLKMIYNECEVQMLDYRRLVNFINWKTCNVSNNSARATTVVQSLSDPNELFDDIFG